MEKQQQIIFRRFFPKCPVCRLKIRRPNRLLKFHVRYGIPEKDQIRFHCGVGYHGQIVILACQYCNYVEYCLRTKKGTHDSLRERRVRAYMLKFGIQL